MIKYIWECCVLVGQIFQSIWYFVVGFFMFSNQWKKQEKAVKDMDVKFYYKKKLRKETNLMSTQERFRISKYLKETPKGERDDFRLFNYLLSVVFRPRPDHTLNDAIKDFYLLLHPYLTTYHRSYLYLRRILKAKNPEEEFKTLLPTLEKRFGKPQDIFAHAERTLERHKKIVREVGQREREFQESQRETELTVDKKMLEEEKKILEHRMEQDAIAKKGLEQAIEDARKNPL